MEIERKFLVGALPDLTGRKKREIVQGYLSVNPVVRIRKDAGEYYLTYKGGGMMVREEFNLPLTEEAFRRLIEKRDGRLIEKTRYEIPLSDGLTAELDLFHGAHEGLTLIEVEFPTREEAVRFIPPEWFGEDVTGRPEYHNSNLI